LGALCELPQPRPVKVGPKAMLPAKLRLPELNDTERLAGRMKIAWVVGADGSGYSGPHEDGNWLMLWMPYCVAGLPELPSVICTGTGVDVALVTFSVVPVLCATAVVAMPASAIAQTAAASRVVRRGAMTAAVVVCDAVRTSW
jgi:hypothetical protein